jgi:hypothetical protein
MRGVTLRLGGMRSKTTIKETSLVAMVEPPVDEIMVATIGTGKLVDRTRKFKANSAHNGRG